MGFAYEKKHNAPVICNHGPYPRRIAGTMNFQPRSSPQLQPSRSLGNYSLGTSALRGRSKSHCPAYPPLPTPTIPMPYPGVGRRGYK